MIKDSDDGRTNFYQYVLLEDHRSGKFEMHQIPSCHVYCDYDQAKKDLDKLNTKIDGCTHDVTTKTIDHDGKPLVTCINRDTTTLICRHTFLIIRYYDGGKERIQCLDCGESLMAVKAFGS